jgi:hypothetical protein
VDDTLFVELSHPRHRGRIPGRQGGGRAVSVLGPACRPMLRMQLGCAMKLPSSRFLLHSVLGTFSCLLGSECLYSTPGENGARCNVTGITDIHYFCNPGLVCNPGISPPTCEPPHSNAIGEPCGGDENCEGALVCNLGRKYPACEPAHLRKGAGVCGADENCAGALRCDSHTHTCTPQPNVVGDLCPTGSCTGGLSCQAGVCVAGGDGTPTGAPPGDPVSSAEPGDAGPSGEPYDSPAGAKSPDDVPATGQAFDSPIGSGLPFDAESADAGFADAESVGSAADAASQAPNQEFAPEESDAVAGIDAAKEAAF